MRLLETAEDLLSEEFGINFSMLQQDTEEREEPGEKVIDVGAC